MTRPYRNRALVVTLLVGAAALPVTLGLAHAATPIGTRDAGAIERDYGRASGDPYWSSREEQPVPAPIEQAYERTRDWLSQPAAGTPPEPDRYGRGGGYVGLDKFEALDWTMRDRTSALGVDRSSDEGRSGG